MAKSQNVLCCVCGEKVKSCKGHRSMLKIALLVTAFLLAVLSTVAYFVFRDNRVSPPSETQSVKVFAAYYGPKKLVRDIWWLENSSLSSEMTASLRQKKKEIKRAFDTYQTLSPRTREVATYFERFGVCMAMSPNQSVGVEGDKSVHLYIRFVPKDKISVFNSPSSFMWATGEGMRISAIEYPEHIFAAVLYHEGWHAVKSNKGKGRAETEVEYATEEIEAHELEGDVLDKASGGRFLGAIDMLIDKLEQNYQIYNYKELIRSLSVADLASLDQILGIENAGVKTAELMHAEYLTLIGTRYIDRHGLVSTEKVRLYIWIRKLAMRIDI